MNLSHSRNSQQSQRTRRLLLQARLGVEWLEDRLTPTVIGPNSFAHGEAGVIMTETAGSTGLIKGGDRDTYEMSLNTQPSADVIISVNADATLSVSPFTLVFTPANYFVKQTINVLATNNALAQEGFAALVTHTATSADFNYSGLVVGTLVADIHEFYSAPTPSGTNVTAGFQNLHYASLTFSNVTTAGTTSLTVYGSGAAPPAGNSFGVSVVVGYSYDPDNPGNPVPIMGTVYYELHTDAVFSGTIDVGLLGNFTPQSRLLHYENGQPEPFDVTTTVTATEIHGTVSSLSPFTVFERELSSPTVVAVDIKPGTDQNSINLANNGVISVALFGSASLTAAQINVSSVTFANAHAVHSALEDVNHDGFLDLVLQFRTQDTTLRATYAMLLAAADTIDNGILDRDVSTTQTATLSLTGRSVFGEDLAGSDVASLFLSGKNLKDALAELAAAHLI